MKVTKEQLDTLRFRSMVMIHGFNSERFNTFLGKLLTQIELLGLAEKQENAFKSLVKQMVWDLWEHPAFTEEKEYSNGTGRFIG